MEVLSRLAQPYSHFASLCKLGLGSAYTACIWAPIPQDLLYTLKSQTRHKWFSWIWNFTDQSSTKKWRKVNLWVLKTSGYVTADLSSAHGNKYIETCKKISCRTDNIKMIIHILSASTRLNLSLIKQLFNQGL